ncbi:MAG: hypothetical protein HGB36_05625 [Chlorobiaceae bacterium]|nr:hypothetical protein [Chlorobiaceae bacterium]
MKLTLICRKIFVFLFLSFPLAGCFDESSTVLDNDDIRFAGFYSDYLHYSGVTAVKEGTIPVVLGSADINALLDRHSLTREKAERKIYAYKLNPERWKLVLDQVRLHIRQQESSGQ